MRTRPFAVALRRFLAEAPFAPFVVELATERLLVYHPEAVRLAAGEVTFVEPDGTVHHFDASSAVRLMATSDPFDRLLDFGLPNGGLFDDVPF